MSEKDKMGTEEIIHLLKILTAKCMRFELLIEPLLSTDKREIQKFCEQNSLEFRVFEDQTIIPVTLFYIRK